VREDAWPTALAVLAGDPELRAAIVSPARVLPGGGGRSASVPSYSAWWLREHATIDGRPLTSLRLADGDDRLAGLLSPVQLELDAEFLAAVGVRAGLEELLAEPGGADAMLDLLADPSSVLGREQLRALYVALSTVDPAEVSPPESLRVPVGSGSHVVRADDVEVVDSPQWLQVPHPARIAVPLTHAVALAEVLDVPVSSQRLAPALDGGQEVDVAAEVRLVLPGAPATWHEHDALVVDGVEVDWWVDDSGAHACTTAGLARALAWSAGSWQRRHLVAAVLADPDLAEALLAESDLDP
jgi:hypothetical protein